MHAAWGYISFVYLQKRAKFDAAGQRLQPARTYTRQSHRPSPLRRKEGRKPAELFPLDPGNCHRKPASAATEHDTIANSAMRAFGVI